jgi:ribosomal protein S27E
LRNGKKETSPISTRLATSIQAKLGGAETLPLLLVIKPDRRCNGKGIILMEKTVMGRRFNPDKYGMIYCPVCKGSGKLFDEAERQIVCKVCGGFGLIRKQASDLEEGFEHHLQNSIERGK